MWGDSGGGHWLVWMEWHPAGWSVCVWLPLLIFPSTIKSKSSLLAPAHLDGPGKKAVKQFWCGGVVFDFIFIHLLTVSLSTFLWHKIAYNMLMNLSFKKLRYSFTQVLLASG